MTKNLAGCGIHFIIFEWYVRNLDAVFAPVDQIPVSVDNVETN